MAKSYLIKDTTREERKQIVQDSLGNLSDCDSEVEALADMYWDYIDGKKEIREINEAFQANYVKGDMELEDRGKCPVCTRTTDSSCSLQGLFFLWRCTCLAPGKTFSVYYCFSKLNCVQSI